MKATALQPFVKGAVSYQVGQEIIADPETLARLVDAGLVCVSNDPVVAEDIEAEKSTPAKRAKHIRR